MLEKRVKPLVSLEDFVEIVASKAFKKNFIKAGEDMNGNKYPDAIAGNAYMTADHKIAVSDETWCKEFFKSLVVECEKELVIEFPKVVFYESRKGTYICYRYGESDVDDEHYDIIVKLDIRNVFTYRDISPVAFELENGFWITVAPTFSVDDSVDVEHMPVPELKKIMFAPKKIAGIDAFKEALKGVADKKNKYDIVLKKLSIPRRSMF